MATVRDFFQFVQSDVPKAPAAIMSAAILGAMREFCTKTNVWIRVSDWTTLLAGQAKYGFTPPAGADVCGILRVAYRSDPTLPALDVKPITYDWLQQNRPGWREETGLAPQLYWAEQPAIVTLIPYPASTMADQPLSLQAEVTLRPAFTDPTQDQGAATVPDFLQTYWGEYIGAGAKVRLMTQPKQPWTGDPGYFLKKFEDGIARCKTQVNKSSTRTSTRVQIPRVGV